MCPWTWKQLVRAEFGPSPFVVSGPEAAQRDEILTMDVFLVSLQPLDDAGVRFQAALPQLVQVIHHVVVGLEKAMGKHISAMWPFLV